MRMSNLSAHHELGLRQTELAAFQGQVESTLFRDPLLTGTKLAGAPLRACQAVLFVSSHELSTQVDRPHNTLPPLQRSLNVTMCCCHAGGWQQ